LNFFASPVFKQMKEKNFKSIKVT